MTLTVTHAKNVAIADDPKAAAAGEVLPSDWNANHVISGTVRDVLTANRNYFVSVTGSDSNGGTNSSTDAWATPQHAMNFIAANLDIAGFIITVNIGAGSFGGVGAKSCNGGGAIVFLGTGSGSTTITAPPIDGVFITQGEVFGINVQMAGTIFSMNAMTIAQGAASSGAFGISIGSNSTIVIGNFASGIFAATDTDIIFAPDTGITSTGPAIQTNNPCYVIVFGGNITIARAGQSNMQKELSIVQGGFFQTEGVVFTVTGSPTYDNAFLQCDDDAVFYNDGGATFTGTVTARRFTMKHDSALDVYDTLNLLPGSLPGIADPSCTYDGSIVPITVADLLANFSASTYQGSRMFATDLTTGVTYGSTLVGGGAVLLPVYSDGTNWRQG